MNTENPFKDGDLQKIQSLVKTYDQLYGEMVSLEENVQKILKAQEAIIGSLKEKREEEERFFAGIAERENVEVQFLKNLATTWVQENKVKTI